jgi:hypothetical protein
LDDDQILPTDRRDARLQFSVDSSALQLAGLRAAHPLLFEYSLRDPHTQNNEGRGSSMGLMFSAGEAAGTGTPAQIAPDSQSQTRWTSFFMRRSIAIAICFVMDVPRPRWKCC